MHQPAVSDWLLRRRSLPLLNGSPHTRDSPPTTWFLSSVLVFLLASPPVPARQMLAYPGSAPCLLVSLLSLDSHLPVHDSLDRWIWNFPPLDLSFELEINISNCPLDISAWMSQRYYKFTMSKLYFMSFPWKCCFLISVKGMPTQTGVQVRTLAVSLGCLFIPLFPQQTPSVTKSSWFFYIFFFPDL